MAVSFTDCYFPVRGEFHGISAARESGVETRRPLASRRGFLFLGRAKETKRREERRKENGKGSFREGTRESFG